MSAELTAMQKKRTCHDTSVEHNPGTSTAQNPTYGMTVFMYRLSPASEQTVRCHDTEISATDRKIIRTGRSQNWLRADC